MRIRWSRRARHDLREIRESISKDAPSDAKQFAEKIIIATERLIDHPKLGRKVPEAEQDQIRDLIFRNYRIIYLIRSDHVYIVTVIHGNRDLTQWETKPWEMI